MDSYQATLMLNAIINGIGDFYHSSFFLFIKILIGLYVLIVFYDIVLLIIQRGFASNLRELKFGIDMPPELAGDRKKTKERWETIYKRLDSENESEYKVAIIEADKMIDELIEKLGYGGENMAERLDNIPDEQLESINEIREAHQIRNRIIHEDDFVVDRDMAEDVMDKYAD